ncbi:LuxR C-terminal-related transcriptional regulator [Nocardiopsis coralliicola]
MSDPRNNLPASDGLIGRERDVEELAALVADTRMVTLTGAGGIGKSRLALSAAARLAGGFADGACFVDMSRIESPEDAPSLIAHVLGLPDTGSADSLAFSLRPLHLLLLLDTCERLSPELGALCTELVRACPRLHILATGTEPVRAQPETVWRVPPLTLAPAPAPGAAPCAPEKALEYGAVQLFVERARAARPGFALTAENTPAVLDVCRRLDGLPLAVELAAARIRVLSAEQVRERLENRFRLLSAAGGGSAAPNRQQSMRAVLEWSHDLLSPGEQALFRRLAVFCSWVYDLLGPVCGFGALPAGKVGEAHAALLDKSLITEEYGAAPGTMYRMTETVRLFSEEKLAVSADETEVWSRALGTAAEWMEGMGAAMNAATPWPERVGIVRLLDSCLENTLKALDHAGPLGLAEPGLRICVALRFHWFLRDLQPQGRSRLEKLMGSVGPGPLRTLAASVRAEMMLDQFGPDRAEQAAEEALRAGRTGSGGAAAATAEAVARTALTAAAARRGDAGAARSRGPAALAAAEAAGDLFGQAALLLQLADAALASGDAPGGRGLLERALALGRTVDDRWTVGRAQAALGELDLAAGALEAASERLAEALQPAAELDLTADIARCTAALGRLDLARGDLSGARRRLSECLRLSLPSGRPAAVARALEGLADLAAAEEQPERAASLAGAADALHPSARAAELRRRAGGHLADDVAEKCWLAWRELPLEAVMERALSFPPRRAHPSLLTPREREISALVAQGLSNRAIAERLVISQATAARHIANIFRKLLFTSRTQLAEWAHRNDLDR